MDGGAAMDIGFKVAESLQPTEAELRQQKLDQEEIKRKEESERQIEEFMRGDNVNLDPNNSQSPDSTIETKSSNQSAMQDQTGRDAELTVYAAKSQAREQVSAAKDRVVDSARAEILSRQSGTDFMAALDGGSASIDLTSQANAATMQAVNSEVTNFAGFDSGAEALAAELRMDAFNRVQGEVATVNAQMQAEEAAAPDDDIDMADEHEETVGPQTLADPLEVDPLEQAEALALEVEPEDAQAINPQDILGSDALQEGPEPEAMALEVEGPQARPESEQEDQQQGPVSADDLLR